MKTNMAAAGYHLRIVSSKYGQMGKTWDTSVFPVCTCNAVPSPLAVLLKIQFGKALAISNFAKGEVGGIDQVFVPPVLSGVVCNIHLKECNCKHLLHESAFMFRVFQNKGG